MARTTVGGRSHFPIEVMKLDYCQWSIVWIGQIDSRHFQWLKDSPTQSYSATYMLSAQYIVLMNILKNKAWYVSDCMHMIYTDNIVFFMSILYIKHGFVIAWSILYYHHFLHPCLTIRAEVIESYQLECQNVPVTNGGWLVVLWKHNRVSSGSILNPVHT